MTGSQLDSALQQSYCVGGAASEARYEIGVSHMNYVLDRVEALGTVFTKEAAMFRQHCDRMMRRAGECGAMRCAGCAAQGVLTEPSNLAGALQVHHVTRVEVCSDHAIE